MNEEKSTEILREKTLTLRAFAIGLILVLVFSIVGLIGAGMAPSLVAGQIASTPPTLMIMVILMLISPLLGAKGFTTGELIVIYVMSSLSIFAGNGYVPLQHFHVLSYASLWSPVAEQVRPIEPSFWFPEVSVRQGMITGGAVVQWSAWSVPLIAWFFYILASAGVNFFFALINSDRIINQERLPFPRAQAVIKILEEPKKPLKEKPAVKIILASFLVGFLFQSTYDILPTIVPGARIWYVEPYVGAVGFDLGPILGPDIALSGYYFIALANLLMMTAIFFIVPTSVTGSALLTGIILWNIVPVIEVKMGILTNVNTFGLYGIFPMLFTWFGTAFEPTAIQLAVLANYGFLIGVFIAFMVLSARSLAGSLAKIVSGENIGEIPSRLAWGGFLASVVIFMGFNVASGIPLLTSLIMLISPLIIVHVTTRTHGEAVNDGNDFNLRFCVYVPAYYANGGPATLSLNTAWYSTRFLAHTSVYWMSAGLAANTLEGIRLCELANTRWRGVVIAAFSAAVVSLGVALLTYVYGGYTYGLQAKWYNMEPHNVAGDIPVYVNSFLNPNAPAYWAGQAELRVWPELIVGIIIAMAVTFLRYYFTWFPINPIGLVLAGGTWWLMSWFPLVLGLISRALVLRVGGSEFYEKKALPAAIGIISGSVTAIFLYGLILIGQSMAG